MRTEVLVGPSPGSLGTWHSSTLHDSLPTSDSFLLEPLPAPWKGVGWTEPWTHKPVLPAEVLSPVLLQAQATLCWFLPSQGKQWAETSFPGPSHPGLFRRWSFASPLPKQAGRLCPPLAPSCLTEQSCGRDWQPSSPPPAWFLPDFFLVRAGTSRCTPRCYIALVSVCLRACVFARAHMAPLKERHGIWHLREGTVLLGRGSFCLVLPLSALLLGWCRVLSPPPPLPAQLLCCPAHPGLWLKLPWRQGAAADRRVAISPYRPPTQAS